MVKDSPGTPSAIARWYLEVEGNKTGPYTAEQVLGFFQEGEILGHHRVSTDPEKGEWVTVESLAQALEPRPSGPFQPPPRPQDLGSHISAVFDDERTDPAHGLFEALRHSRERQQFAIRSAAPSLASVPKKEPLPLAWMYSRWPWLRDRIPPQAYLVGVLSLVLIAAVAGLIQLLEQPAAPLAGQAAPTAPHIKRAAEAPAGVTAGAPAPTAAAVQFPKAAAPTSARLQPPPPAPAPAPAAEPEPVAVAEPVNDTSEEAGDRDIAAVPVADWRTVGGGALPDEMGREAPPAPSSGEEPGLEPSGDSEPAAQEAQQNQTHAEGVPEPATP